MALSDASKAGAVVFVGAVQFSIFLIVAEALSPTYSVSSNYISDLGQIFPASALVFNSSIFLFGVLVLAGSYFLQKAFKWTPGSALVALAGVGLIGVGSFPEGSSYGLHGIFSLLTFLFSALSAIVLARFQRKPMFYFSAVLGLVSLFMLVGYVGEIYLGLGAGGMERMIVYPVLVWALGFGGYLMAIEKAPA